MERLLGQEAQPFFDALYKAPFRAFRQDVTKLSPSLVLPDLAGENPRRVPFADNAYYLTSDAVGRSLAHRIGAVYVQDPAAMAPVAALGKRCFRRVLDLCAAPGGKSLQIASSLLAEDGLIVCNEIAPVRRTVLMQNIERCAERRATVSAFDATRLPDEWRGAFDLVVCDAPCSGEGMMRKNPDAITLWSEEKVVAMASLQAKILDSAQQCVAPGGVLLYATCTFSPEENEEQIDRFLTAHPDFSLVPPAEPVASCAVKGLERGRCAEGMTLRFYPHRFDGEGQFCAVLQKNGALSLRPISFPRQKKKAPDPAKAIVRAFLDSVLQAPYPGQIVMRGWDAYLCFSEDFPVEGLASPGVLIGRVQKGRVVPHHRFFCAMAPFFLRQARLFKTDERVQRYLAGEEIPLDLPDGWGVLMIENCPLGGVKMVRGTAKNHYPKGLRKDFPCTTS